LKEELPLISIVTINLNNAAGIERTLKSISKLKYKSINYVVVDGMSTDGSIEIIKKYSQYISTFICEKDEGIYNAMNKGAEFVRGDWIAFLNSGDIIYPDALNEFHDAYNRQKFDFTLGKVDILHDSLTKNKVSSLNNLDLTKLVKMPAPHMTILTKKEIFKDLGGFNETYKISSDLDFVFRLIKLTDDYYIFKKKYGAFYLGGISSTYLTYFEDYKIHKEHNIKFLTRIVIMLRKLSFYFLKKMLSISKLR